MAEEDFETTRSLRFRTTRFPGFVGVPLSGTEDISIGEGGVRTPQSGLANVPSPKVESLGLSDLTDPIGSIVGKGPLSGAVKGGLSGAVIGGPAGAVGTPRGGWAPVGRGRRGPAKRPGPAALPPRPSPRARRPG